MSAFRPLVLLAALAAWLSPLPLAAKVDPQIEAAVNAVYPALVRIYVVSEEGGGGRMQKQRASGSGTIIHPDGYILTNHHVAGRATRIVINLADRQELRATLVGTDPLADLAVLKIDKKDLRDPNMVLPVARFGDSATLAVGDIVLAMGSPAGLSQSVTQGIVANTEMIAPGGSMRLDGEAVGELVRWIGHDAVIFGGNSGGPLVNLKGEIVGVNEVGIGSLGGAIPSNLASKVSQELIANGRVRRSWIGLGVQPLLKTIRANEGVLVSGVVADSPSATAGLQAGDLITRCNGIAIVASRAPEDIPVFNRILLESPIGSEVVMEGTRKGTPMTWKTTTMEREPAEPREKELLSWGITARDLTKLAARELRRADNRAAVVQSLRPGGAAAYSKPAINSGDLILEVAGKAITNIADLVRVTAEITEGKTKPVPTLIAYEHNGRSYLTVVKIGPEPEADKPGLARKAWIGVDTQVISTDLAEALAIPGAKGVRVTQIYPGSNAEKAGVKVGDLILKLDGAVIAASRPEDSEVFTSLIRQYKIGTEVALTGRRGKEDLAIKLALEASPEASTELDSHECKPLEFNSRDIAKSDRISEKLPDDLKGVLITDVKGSGWAALGGLANGDILISVDGNATESIKTLKTQLEELEKSKRSPFVFFVKRGIATRFIELEPTW
ncbi:MAG: PDZ domain-containing protein [Verrucomicrobia bacterium]|nr:PDZ domain-containing protein [Verrucomicrobiota bacterium]